MRRSLSSLLALAALGAAAAPAHAADEVLAHVDRPTPIAAYGGRVAWSARTPDGRAFRLMTWSGGVVSEVPVAPRKVPFDVDLGPAPDGSVVAVYSRCATEGVAGGFESASYLAGRGCDIYRYDFAGGHESKIEEVSSPTASEVWPTYWKQRVAFARVYDNKRSYPYIYENGLGDAQGSIRMPGGQRNTCARNGRGGRTVCTDDTRSQPLELELYGRRLAFAWKYTDLAPGFAYDLRLDDVQSHDGDPRRLVHQSGGGLTEIILGWPGFEGGQIFWSASCFGDPGGCPHRRVLARSQYTGPLAPATVDPVDFVVSADRDAGFTYLVRDTFGGGGSECRGDPDVPGGTCEVVRTQPAYG